MKRLSLLWLSLWLSVASVPSLRADDALDRRFPVRGFCIGAPSAAQVDRFVQFIRQELAPRRVNTLILRVDYNYQYSTHPELCDRSALSQADVQKIVAVCRTNQIRLIPQINLLGHQSWANHLGALLRVYPDFDETPWVKLPEKYSWPNPDRLYCKSYCPLHPKVHEVVFALVDELCAACESEAFHAGMDEVFYLGEERCPRCGGQDKAKLFADEVTRLRQHLAEKGRKLWIWGDRLLDGTTTGLGEWEASLSGSHRAIDLVPRDVIICDWHYERADPTAAYFALKGFNVVTCPWKNHNSAAQQARDIIQLRAQSSKAVAARVLGLVQTVWSGANSFMDQYDAVKEGRAPQAQGKAEFTEARCFIATFEQIAQLSRPPAPEAR